MSKQDNKEPIIGSILILKKVAHVSSEKTESLDRYAVPRCTMPGDGFSYARYLRNAPLPLDPHGIHYSPYHERPMATDSGGRVQLFGGGNTDAWPGYL